MSCCGGNDKKRRIKEIGDPDSVEEKESKNMKIIPIAIVIALALILYYFLR